MGTGRTRYRVALALAERCESTSDVAAPRWFGHPPTHPHLALVLCGVLLLAACTLSRPDRVVEPETIGVIASVDRSDPSQLVVELSGGATVTIDRDGALELAGPGIDAERVLLFGRVNRRTWYATAPTSVTARPEDCYEISSDAAFDELDSLVLVYADHSDFGVRLPKQEGFALPSISVRPDGRYAGGPEGTSGGSFCIDAHGAVFGIP